MLELHCKSAFDIFMVLAMRVQRNGQCLWEYHWKDYCLRC